MTGEIKLRLRELAAKSAADVVFVEVGGTVGDLENSNYLEACRQLAYEEGEGSVIFVQRLRKVDNHQRQVGIGHRLIAAFDPQALHQFGRFADARRVDENDGITA